MLIAQVIQTHQTTDEYSITIVGPSQNYACVMHANNNLICSTVHSKDVRTRVVGGTSPVHILGCIELQLCLISL